MCCAAAVRAGLGSARKTITVNPVIRLIATISCVMRRAIDTLLVTRGILLAWLYRRWERPARATNAHGPATELSDRLRGRTCDYGGRPRCLCAASGLMTPFPCFLGRPLISTRYAISWGMFGPDSYAYIGVRVQTCPLPAVVINNEYRGISLPCKDDASLSLLRNYDLLDILFGK
jgi:hypothetical protein